MKKNDNSFLMKCFVACMVFVLLVVWADLGTLADEIVDLVQTISENSVSDNETDVPDFDASDIPVSVQGDVPCLLEGNTNLPEGSPSITFARYPTQGKSASELAHGEWMFDQEFARGLLFDQFNIARNTSSNWKVKDNEGNWVAVPAITNAYVWDENLEAVAMQRAIEQVGVDGHRRPNGYHFSDAYKYYSVNGYNPNADATGSDNPYWTAAEANELTYNFNTSHWGALGTDVSTDSAIAYAIVNDPDIGYMEYNQPSGGQKHREAILINDLYRIGIGCVRTSDGHVITAVALAYDWDYTQNPDTKIPVTNSHTAEYMENLFSTTWVTYAVRESAPVTFPLENVVPGNKDGYQELTYVEGTPVLKRPVIDLKEIQFGSLSRIGTAKWRNSSSMGTDETGKSAYILDGTWRTTDASVATVDSNGIVTPVGGGIAQIVCDGRIFSAAIAVEVKEIPLPVFEFSPVISTQQWDVSNGNIKIPYTLVCRSYNSVENYGDALNINDRGVMITSGSSDVSVTNSVSADGMSGTVTLAYTGNKANILDGVSGVQIVFDSTNGKLLNKYIMWMGIENSDKANSGGTGTTTGSTSTESTDVRDDKPVQQVSLKKQTISVGNSKFKKATKKSKAFTVKKKSIKTKKTYDMKVKVTTGSVGHGKVTYKVTYPKGTTKKQKKLFAVKKGKVTLKKGVKKGTYKITITAAGVNGMYMKSTKTVYVKVK